MLIKKKEFLIISIILLVTNALNAFQKNGQMLTEQNFTKEIHEIADSFIHDFINIHQTHDKLKNRETYIQYAQNKQLVPMLINALKDRDWQVRVFSAYLLGAVKEKRSIQTLREVALNDQSVVVRGIAIMSLSEMGDEKIKDQGILNLVSVLQSKNLNDLDKLVTVQMIGSIGDVRAVPALLKSLENTTDSFFYENVLDALGEIGDKQAVPVVIKSLKSESSNVREAALRALGNIRDEQSVFSIGELLSNEQLISVRAVALLALGNIGSEDAVTILIKFIENKENNVYLRAVAVKVLCRTSDDRIDQVLLKILKENENKERQNSG